MNDITDETVVDVAEAVIDVAGLTPLLGDGVDNASVGDAAETARQFLIGGDNAQTLNAGEGGDVIFGGRGDDTINLGAGADIVIYRYDGTDKTNSAAYDGGDVINDFDLSEDRLVLAHAEVTGSALDTAPALFEALKSVNLLVDGDGNITGIALTFTDRANETQEIDLTVNFDEAFDSTQISNLDTLFNAEASGERTIATSQETAAYQAINQVFGESLLLIDFADVGFELNSGETDIV